MESRLDRQNREVTKSRLDNKVSRTEKNHDLYEDLYANGNYTGIADITNKAIVELETIGNKFKTRESYHQIKEYQDIIKNPSNVEKEDLSVFFMEDNQKSYDINDIISSAKQNRTKPDELELKRKLSNTQYDILSDLKLERHENKEVKEEELQELINTITSKGLQQDIDEAKSKELLIELLPTSTNNITVSSSKDILEQPETLNSEAVLDENVELDRTFFSKSLEISKKELESDDELKDLDKGNDFLFKALIVLIFIIVIVTAIVIIVSNL